MPLFRRFGRPGLIGMAARTAVVAGTATAVSGGIVRHQQNRALQEHEASDNQVNRARETYSTDTQPVETVSDGVSSTDFIDELEKLSRLHSEGALSDSEFADAKSKLLN